MFNKLKNHLLENHLNYKIIGIFAIVAIVVTIPLLISKQGKQSLEKESKPKISIICPTIQSFCDEKNEIIKEGKIVGLRAMLPKETPVYAIFDGSVQERVVEIKTKNGIEEYKKITLLSKDNNFIAEYFFKNVKVEKYLVKKEELIFSINSIEAISSKHGNYNFMFLLLDVKAQPIDLNEVSVL